MRVNEQQQVKVNEMELASGREQERDKGLEPASGVEQESEQER